MRTALLALTLVTGLVRAGTAADPPEVNELIARMKAAMEPAKSSLRQIELTISGQDGGTTQWSLAQARKVIDGQARILNVLLAPASSRGIASLMVDGNPAETLLWVPSVRRVRTLFPRDGYESFLGSDFTYFDLGFVRRQDKYTYLGDEQRAGRPTWRIQQVPTSSWYYSKVVSWIDKERLLPVERDFYSPAGDLWKVETFDNVVTIDGQPAALRITMEDKQTGGKSVMTVSNLRFGVEVPDSIFERRGLPQAAEAPIWKGLD
jgi:hypothetical protein